MTLTLDLSPELQQRLTQEAAQQGLPIERYALRLLEQHAPTIDRRKQLVEAIDRWIENDDADEQQETQEYLIRVLDEDRLSNRKLFPEDLKGITW